MVVQGVLLWNAKHGSGMWRAPVSDFPFVGAAASSIASFISAATGSGAGAGSGAGSSLESLSLGLAIVGCCAGFGAISRAAAAAAAMRGAASPHLPRTGRTHGPVPLYLRLMGYELILTCCVATCRNFRVCHAVTTIAFGDAMVRGG